MADSVLHKQQDSMPEAEPTLPSKRKLDPLPIPPQGKEQEEEEKDHPNKTKKLQSFTHNGNSPVNEEKTTGIRSRQPSRNNSAVNSSMPEEKSISKAEAEGNDVVEEEEDDDDADYDDDDDAEEEEENGEAAVVDRKGKGIMIEEEEDDGTDDDDDSSDGGSELDGDGSELEDDPLAEVDLDNILPSRTRRRAAQPGVYIANDLGNNDDDGEDSDA